MDPSSQVGANSPQYPPFAGMTASPPDPPIHIMRRAEVVQTREDAQALAGKQEKLSAAREALLVKRRFLRSSSNNVKDKRTQVGDAEVIFMNLLREYTHTTNTNPLPAPIWEAYQKVEALRDRLGVLEDDHMEKERDLTGDEWRFMDEEADFYQIGLQELFTPIPPPPAPTALQMVVTPPLIVPPPPPPPVQLRTTTGFLITPMAAQGVADQEPSSSDRTKAKINAELEKLEKLFDVLRLEQAERLDSGDIYDDESATVGSEDSTTLSFAQASSSLIQQMMERRAELLRLKGISDDQASALLIEPIEATAARHDSVAQPLHPTHVPIQDFPAEDRVQNYLLQHLEENAVQRTLYANFLRESNVEINQENWRDWITEYWSIESKSERAFESINERLASQEIE